MIQIFHTRTKGALALALIGLAGAGAVQAAPVDLNTWSEKGPPNNGNWVVAADGSYVDQTINGNPTFFVSPESLINREFGGTFEVRTTADDDYIGIVFGYQSPTGNTTSDTDQQFFSFAWKQLAQSGDPPGMFLGYANGTNALAFGGFNNNSSTYTFIQENTTSPAGWVDNRVYDFNLLYNSDRIKIDIQDGVTGSRFETPQTVFDVSLAEVNAALQANTSNGAGGEPAFTEFPSGNFGFFNYSQQSVRYAGITEDAQPIADAGGPYAYNASTATVVLDGSGSSDPDGGPLSYDWTTAGGSKTGEQPNLDIADSGLTGPGSTANVDLAVTDDEGNVSPPSSAQIIYENAIPVVVSAAATRLAGGDVDFSSAFDDADLMVNALVSGFESLVNQIAFLGTTILSGSGSVLQGTKTYAELLSIFGADGSYNAIASVTDSAGITSSLSFLVEVRGPNEPPFPAPAPATLLLLGAGLLGMSWQRRRT